MFTAFKKAISPVARSIFTPTAPRKLGLNGGISRYFTSAFEKGCESTSLINQGKVTNRRRRIARSNEVEGLRRHRTILVDGKPVWQGSILPPKQGHRGAQWSSPIVGEWS